MSQALIIIDLQMDYFEGGAYPQWNAEETLANTLSAVAQAKRAEIPVVLVQHVADTTAGPSPLFNPGTPGVQIHAQILEAAPDSPVVTKRFADAFDDTPLGQHLDELGTSEVLVAGMMTQNCVTYTAHAAARHRPTKVLADCCSGPTQMVHLIALDALSRTIPVLPAGEAL